MFSRRTNWNLEPNPLSRALAEFRKSARANELLDLTASNPTTIGLEYDQEKILTLFSDSRVLEYHPQALGLPIARDAVAAYYNTHGVKIDRERIVLTASTSEGYSFLFRLLCEPGDEVLVPAPSYPLFEYLAGLNDVRLMHYRLFYDHGWHLDWHALVEAVTPRTRAILLVHPNNPTGSYVHAEERAALSRLCGERSLALISDEVFLDYSIDGNAAPTFACNSDCLTFTLSGLSKICGLPQMKLGWMVATGPAAVSTQALERLEVIADTYLSVNTPVQLAAPALLAEAPRFQHHLRNRIRENLSALDRQLAQQSLCSRLEIEAGWYAILRLPRLHSDTEFAVSLLQEAAVLVHPGHFYDFGAEGFMVVSLIPPPAQFAEGLRRLLACAAGPALQ